jgi:hypothetical protein
MPSKRKKKSKLDFMKSRKSRAVLVFLIVGLLGAGYFLYQTFAATQEVKYWGSLTKSNPTATYKLTTGSGEMKLAFSNNTADAVLTVKNSANAVVGSLKSIGKKDVYLTLNVVADTYTFSVNPTKAFTGNKGYKIAVTYPTKEPTKPTAVITSPLDQQTVSGIVDFGVRTEDPEGIAKVEFYADGVKVGTDNTSPYSVKWDTTNLVAGVHKLSVKSYNTIGMFGEASATVTTTKPSEPVVAPNEKFGMSAPAKLWDQRLAEVGGPAHIHFRRIFYQGFDSNLSIVQRAISDKMVPIISFKVTPYSWREVADGKADADIKAMVSRLNAIPGEKFVALHHEPSNDGTAKDWSDMQVHALPIIKSAGQNIKVGVIGNGWWWSARSYSLTDAEIAEWITPGVKSVSDVIAADTYQDVKLNESGGPKIEGMSAWARRTGGVKAMGIGEFNALNAVGITEAMNAVKADPMFKWALVWNSDVTGGDLGIPLEGDRLEAFKKGLATPNQT